MEERFTRTELIFKKDGMEKLRNAKIAVFGAGGVGGYVIEALARSGVGRIDIIDNDTVSVSNINRQIIALDSTVGRLKTDVFAERIKDINPECEVNTFPIFFSPDNSDTVNFTEYTYVCDAIDSVTGKLEIIKKAYEADIPVISSMGTGNKLDPAKLEIADIYKTSVCPLARVMRYELRKRNIPRLKVVYSKEEPVKSPTDENGKRITASVSFVPPSAGLLIASEIVRDIVCADGRTGF